MKRVSGGDYRKSTKSPVTSLPMRVGGVISKKQRVRGGKDRIIIIIYDDRTFVNDVNRSFLSAFCRL